MKTQFVTTTHWPFDGISPTRLAHELESAVNTYRLAQRLGPLRPDPRLAVACRMHAERMRDVGFFAHVDPPSGDGPLERLGTIDRRRWARIAENLAAGQWTAEQVLEGWLASDGHRANLEQVDTLLVGTAVTLGGALNTYIVQLYGTPAFGQTEAPRAAA